MKFALQRFTGLLLSVLLSGVPAAWSQTAQSQSAGAATNASNGSAAVPPDSSGAQPDSAELPDSPGFTQLQAQVQAPAGQPQPNDNSQQQGAGQDAQQPGTQSPPAETTQPPAPAQTEQPPSSSVTPADQNPAGAAAAQRGKTAGVAASRPAGAALAPAKQRHPRSLIVKLGVIAGAGAALGTVFALSQAGGSSRPPGAH